MCACVFVCVGGDTQDPSLIPFNVMSRNKHGPSTSFFSFRPKFNLIR